MKKPLYFFSVLVFVWVNISCCKGKQNKQADITSVKIGDQEWTSINVNFINFRNGDLIPQAKTKEEWEKFGNEGKPAWCFYNDNDVFADYGMLYNWYAISDIRGVCPTGWHIPSMKEWKSLIEEVGGDSLAGVKLKDSTGWSLNGDNSYNFSIRCGGYRWYNGEFVENDVAFWCLDNVSNEKQAVSAIYISDHRPDIDLDYLIHKGAGLPCRCIKD